MSMFNDISWGSKDNNRECESNAQLVRERLKLFFCCNCRVLKLVSTRFGLFCFSFGSLSRCCCHGVPCWYQLDTQFSVKEIRVFQACLVENPSVQVVCFENHAEWRFCLAPFVCRALLAQWRPSALLLPLFSPRAVHVRTSVGCSS